MRLRSRLLSSAFAALCLARGAVASPCCSGASAVPSLISSDHRAQLSLSFDRSAVVAAGRDDVSQTMRVDAATLLGDRWQVGASLPVVRRTLERAGTSDTATALGDARLSLAWEALPEWEYSAWKPRGFLFAQLTVPTGTSPYEGREVEGVGRGFFTASVGTLLVKRGSRWDVFLVPEVHYGFPRTFGTTSVRPGFGGSLAAGVGFSPFPRLRFGIRAQPVYESPRQMETSAGPVTAAEQLTWNAGADVGVLVADGWTVAASYTDPTLLGSRGIEPARTVTVAVQWRLPR